MREIENISSELFDKIRTRFENVRLGDDKSKATTDPEKARFFNFDYAVDGNKIGNITISLIDDTSLKIYYSKNIVDDLKALDQERGDDDEDKDIDDKNEEEKWYGFLRGLRKFAKRNLLSFDTRDITKSNLQIKDVKQQAKADSTLSKDDLDINVNESRMFGTRRSSYQECGPVRIIVRHSGEVDEEKRGARSRNIESVFLETHLGERFLLPFKNLHGARAMAQHCSQGGSIHDELGEGICAMVEEMNAMRHFVRSVGRRQFEDAETDEMAHAAVQHYNELKNKLRHIGGHRGYGDYRAEYVPVNEIEDDVNINDLRERFVKKIYDEKFDAALPYVYRAHMRQKEMENNSMIDEFASWADSMTEGAWALPDQEDDNKELDALMSKPLPVGVDAQNATGELYNIIGDDSLFDKLHDFANSQGDAADNADCREIIINWLRDNSYTELANKYEQLYTQNQAPLQAQAQQNQADAAQQAAQAQGQGQTGSPGTAEPSPAQRPEMQEGADSLAWMRRLAGLK
jgi:hypothetical protein